MERWNPPFCGEIDMRIARDGSWHYMGTPIGRPALVRLFSTVLRKDEDRYVLVTPVEKVGITVEDVPFIAAEVAVQGEGEGRSLVFTTSLGDTSVAGPAHPMRFEREATGGYRPYVHVRGGLWARASRSVYLDLVAMAEPRSVAGEEMLALVSGGSVFPIAPLSEIGEAP